MGRLLAIAAAAALLIAPHGARADQVETDAQQALQSLKFQGGTIALGNNLASLTLTPNFQYLSPDDTKRFLVDVWRNPPDAAAGTLGSIVPAKTDLGGAEGWAIIISYDDSGHVSDDDAAGIDYDQLLKDMQKDTLDHNEDRKKQGYEPIELVGWAEPPHYDSQAKKLYWAKRLKFGGETGETLNYSIRALGRKGVLELTVVASMQQLATIDGRIDEVLGMVALQFRLHLRRIQPRRRQGGGVWHRRPDRWRHSRQGRLLQIPARRVGRLLEADRHRRRGLLRRDRKIHRAAVRAPPKLDAPSSAPRAAGYSRPAWKSAKAWAISSRVFMTKGP